MRTETFLTCLLTAALLPACDPGEPIDREDPSLADLEEAEVAAMVAQLAEPVHPASMPEPVDELVDDPDPTLDVDCTSYYFANSESDTKKSACSATMTAGDYPGMVPIWNNLFNWELNALANAYCANEGARNGDGELPAPGAGAPGGGELGTLVDPSAGPVAAGGALPGGINPVPATAPALCETLCQSAGKVWDSGSSNFGTCAFDKLIALQPPEHDLGAPACLAPNTQPWKMSGSIEHKCGCRCVTAP